MESVDGRIGGDPKDQTFNDALAEWGRAPGDFNSVVRQLNEEAEQRNGGSADARIDSDSNDINLKREI